MRIIKRKAGLLLYVILISLMLLVIISMSYILNADKQLDEEHSSIIKAIEKIQLQTTLAHLWSKETITGDTTIAFNNIISHIELAEWFTNSILEGRTNDNMTIISLKNPLLRKEIIQIQKELNEFKEIAITRWESKNIAEIGSEMDLKYDKVFDQFYQDLLLIEQHIQNYMVEKQYNLHRLQKILIIGSLMLFIVMLMLIIRHVNTIEKSEQEIKRREEELIITNEKLKRSEQKFRILYDNSPDMYISVSPIDASIIMCNATVFEKTGYAKDEVIGQPIFKMYHTDCMEEVHKTFQQFVETGEIKNKELIVKRKDGSKIDVSLSVNAVRDENGKILYSISSWRDISERKQASQALKESEKKFKSMVSNIPGIVYRCANDEFWTMEYISDEIEKLSGFPATDFVNNNVRSYTSIIHPNDIEFVNNTIQNSLDAKQIFEIEYRIIDKKENILWVYEKGKGVFNVDGELQFLDGAIFNITDRKKAQQVLKENEERLRELNATKDKFFSIIAHDLKGPFNTILGFSNILMIDFDNFDVSKQKEFIGIIQQGAENTHKLLENLLQWSRAQRGIIDFNPELENLYLLSIETIEALSQLAKNKSISLKNEISKDIFVNADKNMLLTILRNLITNAIKFSPKGSEIAIDASPIINENNQNYTEISVKDSGIGISPEIQSRLFKIAENVSTKGTENEEGTGLGLILCKEFVEKHRGKIWVESEVGKGSEFKFTIP